jgi:hypothetical protein
LSCWLYEVPIVIWLRRMCDYARCLRGVGYRVRGVSVWSIGAYEVGEQMTHMWVGVRVKDKVSAWQFRQVVIMPKGRRK